MADDKPAKKKSPLYDAPKDGAKHGARAEKPEKKPDPEPKAEAKPASDKDPTAEKAPKNDNGTAKAEKPKEEAGTKPADKAAGGEEEPKKPAAHEALNGIHKRHETERRDHHGNVREQYRTMASRHEKELKDFHAAHMAELTAGNAPAPGVVPGNAPEKPQAQAVAAAAPSE